MFNMYGCPTHYGVGDEGLLYSLDYLNQYYDLDIPIVPEITVPEKPQANLKNLKSVLATCNSIAKYQDNIIRHYDTPILIGGDRTAAIGSVSGTSVNFRNPGLIWICAHPCLETSQTTTTGDIQDMAVASLLGMGEKSLTKILTSRQKIRPENVVMLGLREMSPVEHELLKDLEIRYFTFEDICSMGLSNCLELSRKHLAHTTAVHLTLDLDVMDPDLIPGVSTPVSGGLDFAQFRTTLSTFLDLLPIEAIDILGYNMSHDTHHQTAAWINRVISSILEREDTVQKAVKERPRLAAFYL